MISKKFKKGMLLQDFASGIMQETGEGIIKRQSAILKANYSRRSGTLLKNLQSKPFSVMRTLTGARLIIAYEKRIRFLDLKFSSTGKVKDKRTPIYNKPLYGYIYGYAYSQLRYGFNEYLRENTSQAIQESLKEPIVI